MLLSLRDAVILALSGQLVFCNSPLNCYNDGRDRLFLYVAIKREQNQDVYR